MFTKTMLAVSAAMVLGAASLATAGTEREGGFQVRAWQGAQEQTHSSLTTDVSRAYALDQSSQAKKKKAPKQAKTQPQSTSGAASRAESAAPKAGSDAQRRYEANH